MTRHQPPGRSESAGAPNAGGAADRRAARVLFVNGRLDRAEVELLLRMHREGVFVRALARADTPGRDLLEPAGIFIEAVPYRSKMSPRFTAQIARLIRRHRIDIVHATESRALANVIWATHFRRAHIIGYRGTLSKVRRSDPSYRMGLLHPRVARIFCVSEAVRTYLAPFVPAEKLVVNYKGFDPAWIGDTANARLPAGTVPEDALLIMHIGNARGRPHKGLEYLIEAFHMLGDARAHLMLFGNYSDGIPAQIAAGAAAGRIHLLGEVDDAARYLARADVYVQPSLLEGLPRSLKEAMAIGVAIVVSDIPSLAEMIVDGESGLLVPPADATALAGAMQRLLRQPELRARLAANAQHRLAEHFSPAAYYERTMAVYGELMAASGAVTSSACE